MIGIKLGQQLYVQYYNIFYQATSMYAGHYREYYIYNLRNENNVIVPLFET